MRAQKAIGWLDVHVLDGGEKLRLSFYLFLSLICLNKEIKILF